MAEITCFCPNETWHSTNHVRITYKHTHTITPPKKTRSNLFGAFGAHSIGGGAAFFGRGYSRNGTLHVHVHDEYNSEYLQHLILAYVRTRPTNTAPAGRKNTRAIPRPHCIWPCALWQMISTRLNRAQRQSFTSIELYANWLIQFALEAMRRIWCVWILPWRIATFGPSWLVRRPVDVRFGSTLVCCS